MEKDHSGLLPTFNNDYLLCSSKRSGKKPNEMYQILPRGPTSLPRDENLPVGLNSLYSFGRFISDIIFQLFTNKRSNNV